MAETDTTETTEGEVTETTTEEETETTLSAEDIKALRDEAKAATDEANRLKRIVAEKAKESKAAEAAAKKAAEEKAKKEGDWQKIAEEREREAEEARKEAAEALERVQSIERTNRVTSAASRLKFRDPTDAARFLTSEEQDDDKLAEAALKRLAREKPYLVDEQRRSGGDITDSTTGLTPEQEHQETLKRLLGG